MAVDRKIARRPRRNFSGPSSSAIYPRRPLLTGSASSRARLRSLGLPSVRRPFHTLSFHHRRPTVSHHSPPTTTYRLVSPPGGGIVRTPKSRPAPPASYPARATSRRPLERAGRSARRDTPSPGPPIAGSGRPRRPRTMYRLHGLGLFAVMPAPRLRRVEVERMGRDIAAWVWDLPPLVARLPTRRCREARARAVRLLRTMGARPGGPWRCLREDGARRYEARACGRPKRADSRSTRLLQPAMEFLWTVRQSEAFEFRRTARCVLAHEYEVAGVGHQHQPVVVPVAAHLIAVGRQPGIVADGLHLDHAALRHLSVARPALLHLLRRDGPRPGQQAHQRRIPSG